jgi:hypothetical protein
MVRGITARASVAIFLMAVTLLSCGLCVSPAQPAAAHSCCMHMSMPCQSSRAACCASEPQAPAAAVTAAFTGLTPIDIAERFLSAMDHSISRDAALTTVNPSQSPPGAFSLRI